MQVNFINGLKKHSLVRVGKIETIDKSLAIGKLGNITNGEITEVHDKLILLFQLKTN